MTENNNIEIIKSIISAEFKPEIVEMEKVNLSLFDNIPYADLSVLGTAFLPMIQSLQNVGSHLLGTSSAPSSKLYRVSLPKGATHLAMKKDRSGYITAAFDDSNRLVGQASITPEGIAKDSPGVSTINPYMFAIAAMIMSVNMKLNDIKRGQEDLMAFLEQKEKAKLEGNLFFLSDILNNYKLNWNNERYVNANHIKVLDIKQQSEQSISLFKKQVQSVLNEDALFHTTKKVSKNINQLLTDFDSYRLSVYMYAFSSYVDVLLLENFESEFLQKITAKISKYALEYREVYSDVYATLERYTKRSIRSIASRGAAGITKSLGKAVEKIPKLCDTQMDENLFNASEKIAVFDEDTNKKIARTITSAQKVDVSLFTENINRIEYLANYPFTVLLSNDSLYIESGR